MGPTDSCTPPMNQARETPLRVYLVEDFQSMRALMSDLFRTLGGIQVIGTAGTEAEARLWLEDHPGEWDVAIIDLVLAQGSGFRVVDCARRTHPPGRIAVCSGYTSLGLKAHCVTLGASAVFDKTETAALIAWMHEQAGSGRKF